MKIDFRFINKRKSKREVKNKEFGEKYIITLNKEAYNHVQEDCRVFSIPSCR